MNKLLLLLFAILLIGCCNQPELLNNGLTKKVNKITEYVIEIKYDSIDKSNQDTIVITERYYNNNDQIMNSLRKTQFDNLEINFVYDNFNKIEKEIVKMLYDSSVSIVDYIYKDSLLYQTKAESKNVEFQYSLTGNYKYHSNKKLKEISISQIYIDLELEDTTLNSIELYKYNMKGVLLENEIDDTKNQTENKKFRYKYKCNGMLAETKEYNQNDSLISTTNYKYESDEFGNWITRKSIENGKTSFIKTRNIEYK